MPNPGFYSVKKLEKLPGMVACAELNFFETKSLLFKYTSFVLSCLSVLVLIAYGYDLLRNLHCLKSNT